MALALKTFAHITVYTDTRHFFGAYHFRFTIPAKAFLSRLHGPITGNDRHGANVDTRTALPAEIGTQTKGRLHTAIFSAPDKADGLFPKASRADLNAAPAQNTIIVPERIADLLYTAAKGDILNSAGVGRLCNDQFGKVAAKPQDFFRTAQYHHALFNIQSA